MLQQVHNMQTHGNTIKLQMDVLAVKKRPDQIFRRNMAYIPYTSRKNNMSDF